MGGHYLCDKELNQAICRLEREGHGDINICLKIEFVQSLNLNLCIFHRAEESSRGQILHTKRTPPPWRNAYELCRRIFFPSMRITSLLSSLQWTSDGVP